ncbi:thiamine diphosphokinase [Lactobacillus agrestimuris]|uniref:thiamine diphosphokinase n=1 Tax=Lactobacillus agrestimuris TaxID=2941328 RepID=UPI0020449EC1|nr:thiamine diphosphokinase [Lactobacillus agrestimuris]
MKAYALLGGPKSEWPQDIKETLTAAKRSGDLIIGVDRGSFLLTELGIIPDLAIGDFDSLKKKELNQIESQVADIRYSNPVKDLTDSELMIRIAFKDYKINQLIIYGATGGRIDHFLTNLFMITNEDVRKFAEKISIVDKQNQIYFYKSGIHKIKKSINYPYFGIYTLGPIKNLNISLAKYDLKDFSNDYPKTFASNEFLPEKDYVEIAISKGMIAVIFSKDIDRFYNIK